MEKNLGSESDGSGFDPNYIETPCLPAEGLSSRKQTINVGEDAGERKQCILRRDANDCSHHGNKCTDSSQNKNRIMI